MRILYVDPKKVWGFQPDIDYSIDLMREIRAKGTDFLPPVPVFKLDSYLQGEYNWILADGHHRRNAASAADRLLKIALYARTEKINVERDNLAPFRHAEDPQLHKKLILFYLNRNNIEKIAKRANLTKNYQE